MFKIMKFLLILVFIFFSGLSYAGNCEDQFLEAKSDRSSSRAHSFEQVRRHYAKEAINSNSAKAQFNLSKMLLEGLGGDKDEQQGLEWLRKSAEQGYAAAQYFLGHLHEGGQIEGLHPDKAIGWYIQSAMQGYEDAQLRLGHLYKIRNSLESIERSISFYKRAAENHSVEAQRALGSIYNSDLYGVQNLVKAERWYKKAAMRGDPKAQSSLIEFYNQKRKTSEEESESIEYSQKSALWLKVALENDKQNSKFFIKTELEELEASLTSEQIQEVENKYKQVLELINKH